jgi:hypothetical protein
VKEQMWLGTKGNTLVYELKYWKCEWFK